MDEQNAQVSVSQATEKPKKKEGKMFIKLKKRNEEMIVEWVRKYVKIIKEANERNLNENDTSIHIHDMMNEIRWYDKMTDITTEYKIRNQFCDYGIKINDKLIFLIEAKTITRDLSDDNTYQANAYAATEWVKRVVLTNLRERRLYRLSYNSWIEQTQVLGMDFLNDTPKDIIEKARYLHKESFIKKHIEKLYQHTIATSKDSFQKALLSDSVIKRIRFELKAASWIKVPEEEIKTIIKWLINEKEES